MPSARRKRRKRRCPSSASPASARVPRQISRDLSAQSSVNASQAMLSQATLSHAMLSHATLSQATLSQATLSQATLSQATLFQARVSHVSRNQGIPPRKGSFQLSGEPKRTGYSARAKPSAGRSPLLAQGTVTGFLSMPARNPPDRSPPLLGAASHGAARVAAYASSSPLPSAIGSGRTWPLFPPYCCVVPTMSALT